MPLSNRAAPIEATDSEAADIDSFSFILSRSFILLADDPLFDSSPSQLFSTRILQLRPVHLSVRLSVRPFVHPKSLAMVSEISAC